MEHRPVALVTGATSGIGRVVADLLAAGRYDLVLVARDGGALGELTVELDKVFGAASEVVLADLATRRGIAQAVRRIEEGDVEVLVNCAGAGWYGRFADQDLEEATGLIALDVLSITTLCRAAVGPMVARGAGKILNVSSTASFVPGPNGAVYHAAKAYVTSFTEALHEELLPHGIHVTALCPGPTPTRFQARAGVRREGLPEWLWSDPTTVAVEGLAALWENEALCVPGLVNRALLGGTRLVPRGVARKASGRVLQRLISGPGTR